MSGERAASPDGDGDGGGSFMPSPRTGGADDDDDEPTTTTRVLVGGEAGPEHALP